MSLPISTEIRERMHREFVTTDISIRALAEKYGVGKSTLFQWVQAGNWTAEKNQCLKEAQERAQDITRTDIAQHTDMLTERAQRIYESADKLLRRVNEMLDLEDALAPRDLQSLSSTLMNIKMIHGIPDKLEDDSGRETVVTLTGDLSDYAK